MSVEETAHARGARMATERALANPEAAARIVEILGWMKTGVLPACHVDAMVQKGRGDYDLYDAYCVARVDMLVAEGKLAMSTVSIGSTPGRDSDTAGNQAKLDRIEFPYRATFWGGLGDYDGQLTWEGEAPFFVRCGDEMKEVRLPLRMPWIPLEVGTTSASRSLLHIVQDRALARWPYGHDACFVYYMMPHVPIFSPFDRSTYL